MRRTLTVLVMAGVVLVAGAGVMASAFTTATVDRDADLTVEGDGGAVIEIEAGAAAQATTNGRAKLTIDMLNANKDSGFEFGDISDPSTAHVFRFTNTDGTAHTFNVGINNLGGGAKFHVDEPGNVTTVTGPGTSDGFSLADSETAYVAIEITNSTGNNYTAGDVYINSTGPAP